MKNHLDMGAVNEPWLMTHELVELAEIAQLDRYVVEAEQPLLLTMSRSKEFALLLFYQIGAFVTRSRHDSDVVT